MTDGLELTSQRLTEGELYSRGVLSGFFGIPAQELMVSAVYRPDRSRYNSIWLFASEGEAPDAQAPALDRVEGDFLYWKGRSEESDAVIASHGVFAIEVLLFRRTPHLPANTYTYDGKYEYVKHEGRPGNASFTLRRLRTIDPSVIFSLPEGAINYILLEKTLKRSTDISFYYMFATLLCLAKAYSGAALHFVPMPLIGANMMSNVLCASRNHKIKFPEDNVLSLLMDQHPCAGERDEALRYYLESDFRKSGSAHLTDAMASFANRFLKPIGSNSHSGTHDKAEANDTGANAKASSFEFGAIPFRVPEGISFLQTHPQWISYFDEHLELLQSIVAKRAGSILSLKLEADSQPTDVLFSLDKNVTRLVPVAGLTTIAAPASETAAAQSTDDQPKSGTAGKVQAANAKPGHIAAENIREHSPPAAVPPTDTATPPANRAESPSAPTGAPAAPVKNLHTPLQPVPPQTQPVLGGAPPPHAVAEQARAIDKLRSTLNSAKSGVRPPAPPPATTAPAAASATPAEAPAEANAAPKEEWIIGDTEVPVKEKPAPASNTSESPVGRTWNNVDDMPEEVMERLMMSGQHKALSSQINSLPLPSEGDCPPEFVNFGQRFCRFPVIFQLMFLCLLHSMRDKQTKLIPLNGLSASMYTEAWFLDKRGFKFDSSIFTEITTSFQVKSYSRGELYSRPTRIEVGKAILEQLKYDHVEIISKVASEFEQLTKDSGKFISSTSAYIEINSDPWFEYAMDNIDDLEVWVEAQLFKTLQVLSFDEGGKSDAP